MLTVREEREFPVAPESVPAARRLVRQALQAWDRSDLVDGSALVVTELVTNAVLHARAPIRLVLEPRDPDGLRIEVHDGSTSMPLRPRADEGSTTGRGMGLVALLAERWGAEPEEGGKVVWVEISPETESAEAPVEIAPVASEFDLESWEDLLAELGPDELDQPEPATPARRADAQGRVGPLGPADDRVTVELGEVPTDLLLAAKAHVDALLRELTLTAGGAASGVTAALPEHLAELIRDVTSEFAEARQEIKRQALAAQARDEQRTHLSLTLPTAAAQAGRRYLDALEEADVYARGARLLTLAAPPQHIVFRRWYVTCLASALQRAEQGLPAEVLPTFEAYLLQTVDVLAELQLASALSARLHRATASLASEQGLAQVAATALGHARTELGATGGAVLVAEGKALQVLASEGAGHPAALELVTAETPAARAHLHGSAVWVESREERDEAFPELVRTAPGVVATCAVPLLVAGLSIGALELTFPEARLFTSDERAFLTALGGVAAQTLERARLDESRGRVVQRLTRLQAVTSALSQVRHTDGVLDAIVDQCVGSIGARAASLSLLDHDGSTLRLVRMRPLVPEAMERFGTFSLSDDGPVSEALRTGTTLWVKDIAERDRRWPSMAGLIGDFEHSLVVLPLTVEDVVLGGLTLTFAADAFGPREPSWEFYEAIADAVAQALERARATERVESANRKLAFLADAADLLSGSLDVDRTLVSVARLAVPELADWCVVHLLEEGALRPVATEHVDPSRRDQAVDSTRRWPARLGDTGGVGQVVRTGRALLVPDAGLPESDGSTGGIAAAFTQDEEHRRVLDELGLQSLAVVPLVARGRTLGAISLMTAAASGRRYDEEDLAFIQELARRVAVAVDNARMFKALESGPAAAPGGSDTSERLALVVETMVDAFFRMDSSWRFTYVNRQAEQLLGRSREELLGRVLWAEFPEAAGSVFQEQYEQALRSGQQVGFESYYGPLDMWFEVKATPDPDGLSVFFHRIDERRQIEAERERANERLRLVAMASSRFAALLQPMQVLDALADLVVPAMAAYTATALRGPLAAELVGGAARDEEDVRVVHVRHQDRVLQEPALGFLRGLPLSTRDEFGAGAVTGSGVAQEIPQLTDEVFRAIVGDNDEAYAGFQAINASSGYTVPLVSRGRTLGALSLGDPSDGAMDRALVAELASRAAVALDNALLYRAERRNGIELQRHLLPRVSPSVPGVQIATRYLPSLKGALTGGDFYEAIETGDGLVLALGDVVGHGMRSAARMGQLRAIVAALALQRLDPADLLAAIAADVDKMLDLGLATLLVCRYDQTTRTLTYASAGHPPPLVAERGAAPAYLPLDAGPPLGVGAYEYPEHSGVVPAGATVVLFSDGLVENRGESLTDGLERLRQALLGVEAAPQQVADLLLTATGREHGGDDDVALLVLRHDA